MADRFEIFLDSLRRQLQVARGRFFVAWWPSWRPGEHVHEHDWDWSVRCSICGVSKFEWYARKPVYRIGPGKEIA